MSQWSNAQLVTNTAELQSAISNVIPGSTITLSDGTWNNIYIGIEKNGTEAEPITITAQNPGAVIMTGNSRAYLEGSYLTISGLIFQDPSNLTTSSNTIKPVIELKRCDNCKIINNKIDHYNGTEDQKGMKFKWILADGQHNEIAYNSFIGKYGIGSIINDNRNSKEADYLKIHHNYFADRTPINGLNEDNDQDAIRIGNSSTSLDDSYTEVYENYFYNFFGEVEVISNKSGQNKYYNNTFRNYAGTLTLRHGNNCEVYGNYFFADNNLLTGGVRVIGEGHKIYNNYIEGVNSKKSDGSTSNGTGGINITNGRLNSEVSGYFQVKNTDVINNTFVNCDYALRIGTKVKSDLDQAPENLNVSNNIMYNTSINEYQIITMPSGTSISEGNITNLAVSDMQDDGNFHRLTSESLPIDAGIGTYVYLTEDILGGARDDHFDAGAEEFGGNGSNLPFIDLDVGVKIGFGAISAPTLAFAASSLTFGKYEDTMTFEVVANVDWSITEDISWLSLDKSSGSGRTTVTAYSTENTTGEDRSGVIQVDGTGANNELSATLSALQLNTFIPSEIPIIGSTSIGMQVKEGIAEENAYNDDINNYWTGDPDTEDEVSITFDLGCLHDLTHLGINFWKADERITTFSIAISDEAEGPFNTIIDNETSSDDNATVNTEQLFDLDNNVSRYVKFIGIGNSSSTNWTSIANINIYGDTNCTMPVGVIDNQLLDRGITIFPVPTTNGILFITSDSKPINNIDIYNINGQNVWSAKSNNTFSQEIDISALETGVYFIKLKGIGQSTFIVN